MGGIMELHVVNKNVPADRILKNAMGKMDKVIVAGITKSGEYYIASTVEDSEKASVLINTFREYLMAT